MISQEKLNIQESYLLWLTKRSKMKNVTNIANENQFIIVNPEEIGMRIITQLKTKQNAHKIA